MSIGPRTQAILVVAATVAAGLVAFQSSAYASEPPCAVQESIESENSQPALARLRTECPLLAGIVEEFVLQDLGEAFPGEIAASPTPEISAVAAFAAAGDIVSLQQHARSARAAGATAYEFKEMLYLTTVNSGVPKAIAATRALTDVLSGREERCGWELHHTL